LPFFSVRRSLEFCSGDMANLGVFFFFPPISHSFSRVCSPKMNFFLCISLFFSLSFPPFFSSTLSADRLPHRLLFSSLFNSNSSFPASFFSRCAKVAFAFFFPLVLSFFLSLPVAWWFRHVRLPPLLISTLSACEPNSSVLWIFPSLPSAFSPSGTGTSLVASHRYSCYLGFRRDLVFLFFVKLSRSLLFFHFSCLPLCLQGGYSFLVFLSDLPLLSLPVKLRLSALKAFTLPPLFHKAFLMSKFSRRLGFPSSQEFPLLSADLLQGRFFKEKR